ncbi:transcription factor bHLH119 [Eutrema salsugineum]|uniref:transcription factor bHLH119 n=1 Tax=Eutrema salsugineum TaxID=72664 RepID=UPI000CED7B0D|nr:transcription factor bHLH119 [Eutrema salsugineum]
MGEDDIVELLWKSGQVVQSSQSQRPISVPPPILRGSGSGGGGGVEGNAPLPLPPPPHTPLLDQPEPSHHQSLLIQEDEMVSWLYHTHREDGFYSDLIYPGVASIPATQPLSSASFAPPPPVDLPSSQILDTRRVANFTNLSRFRGNIFSGGRVEAAGPLVPLPVVSLSTQVGSSLTPSSSATESCLTPATQGSENRSTAIIGGVSRTFVVPGLEKVVATEIAGTSSSGVSKVEAEPIQVQPATETRTADDRKGKERQETADDIEDTKEAPGSTSRKRSRAAEMHNLSERKRRGRINERMKALQELVPRSNKSDKASMLEDAIEYVKSLQMQLHMMSQNMQQFMPHMAMGMMGMNRPPFIHFPGIASHMAGPGPSYPAPPYPFPNNPAFDPSRLHLPSQQPDPAPNQPRLPGYLNPYSQFVGLPQMQQPPPPLQNQTTSQLSFSLPSSVKEPEDQENQPTD